MATPSLLQDCRAWLEKGQESWDMYFSKWETFAKYEENIAEVELICKISDKHRKKRNKNKTVLKQSLCQKRLRTVFYKNHQKRQKMIIKKKIIEPKTNNGIDYKSPDNETSPELIENCESETILATFFSDFLKANTLMCGVFSPLLQKFPGEEMTVKESSHFLSKRQLLPCNKYKINAANHMSDSPKVLASPRRTKTLYGRSICPARRDYLQALGENFKETHLIQIQSKQEQSRDFTFGAPGTMSFGLSNFSNQQFLSPGNSQKSFPGQTPKARNSLLLEPNMLFESTSLQSVHMGSHQKLPSRQNEKHKNVIISKINISQEGKFCSPKMTNNLILRAGNANFIQTRQSSSKKKAIDKTVSQTLHSSKRLIFGDKEDDSDSDDQAVRCSPHILIHSSKKRLKTDESVVDAVGPDADDCESIFDRIVKS